MTITTPLTRKLHQFFIVGLVATLAACDGGGGSKSSNPAAIIASSNAVTNNVVSSSMIANPSTGGVDALSSASTNSSIIINGVSTSSSSSSISTTSNSVSSISSIITSSSVVSITNDTTPDAFSFTAITGAAVNANLRSAIVTISGINTATPISITGGKYAIGSGAATSNAGVIRNGQTVTVSLLTSELLSTTTQAVLTIGGVTATFAATTELPDTTPNSFAFKAVSTSALNTVVISNLVTVSGINMPAPISISNGQYSINGGAFTSAAGTVTNGQTIAVKVISAASANNITQASLTIGGVTEAFSVNVFLAYLMGGAIQGTPLNIATVVTTLAGSPHNTDGASSDATFSYPSGMFNDGTNLYIADAVNHSIRKIVLATGEVSTIAGGTHGNADGIGAAATFEFPEGITGDGTNLYIADADNNSIRQLVIATGAVTTIAGGSEGDADGTGTAATFSRPSGIAIHDGNLYVTDTYNESIRKIVIATGEVTTFAGGTSDGDNDGIGTDAHFSFPEGIATDGTNLYVADSDYGLIRKIVIATAEVTTLAGTAFSSDRVIDGTGTAAHFDQPYGITTDNTNLYVADYGHNSIRKIVIATGVVTTIAGSGSEGNVNGTGAAASFNSPQGISIHGDNLYVADTENGAIRKIVLATAAVTTFAGSKSNDNIDGKGKAANFVYPSGVTSDGTNLYIADTESNSIRKLVIASGEVTTIAGGSQGNADGIGAAASFNESYGITTDGANLYVADTYNHSIRKIVIATGAVTTIAGGSEGNDDGIGLQASFSEPYGITTDGINLYVADSYNDSIRKVVITTAEVTTIAGGSWGNTDGTGTAAKFRSPEGITTDGTNLYVADTRNNSIRKIVIATGVVTTIVSDSFSSDDSAQAEVSFDWPSGITTDGTNLYVVDKYNHSIRKIVIATGVVTTIAGSSIGNSDGVGAAAKFYYPSGITTNGFELFVTDTGNSTIRKIQ